MAKEKALIEKSARKSGLTVSEYVRDYSSTRRLTTNLVTACLDQNLLKWIVSNG
jgi:hypothetical protein